MKADSEINSLLDDIDELLAQMPKEERLQWFRKSAYPRPLNFVKEIDDTKYVVRTFFDKAANESIEEKLKRIVLK